MKKVFKSENAITLIALVVTIIILLILAGVTVGFSMYQTGLFDKAKLATDKYNNEVDKENYELGQTVNNIEDYSSFARAGTSNISYSYDEQDTGLKWVDGKTIYQKSFNISFTWTSSRTWMNPSPIDLTSLNPESIISISGITDVMGQQHSLPYIDNSTCYVGFLYIKSTHVISMVTSGGDNTAGTGIITIQYTKTTD